MGLRVSSTLTKSSFDVEALMKNENAKVSIGGVSPVPIRSFTTGDFSFGTGNEFVNVFESQAQDRLNQMKMRVAPIAGKIGEAVGIDNLGAFVLKSLEQTIESWSKSQKPAFTVRLLFVATYPTDNVVDNYKKLVKAVLPTKSNLIGKSSGSGSTMVPPLGYSPILGTGGQGATGLSLNAKGTLSLSIGKWFYGYGLIMKNCSPSMSQSVIQSGKPLYMTVDVTMEPYRLLSYNEFIRFFR